VLQRLALRLKIICHYGAFLEQTVGGRTQVAGSDVILAHRLLKNRLAGSINYALLTRAALETVGVDPAHTGLVAHTERYEHFGEIECFFQDVDAASTPANAGVETSRQPQAAASHASPAGVS
jgi:hypothetical protein